MGRSVTLWPMGRGQIPSPVPASGNRFFFFSGPAVKFPSSYRGPLTPPCCSLGFLPLLFAFVFTFTLEVPRRQFSDRLPLAYARAPIAEGARLFLDVPPFLKPLQRLDLPNPAPYCAAVRRMVDALSKELIATRSLDQKDPAVPTIRCRRECRHRCQAKKALTPPVNANL